MALEKIDGFKLEYTQSKTSQDFLIEHYHNACELSFFVAADLHIFVKDMNYAVEKGDIVFVDEFEIHKIVYNESASYIRYVLNIEKELLAANINRRAVESLFAQLQGQPFRKIHLSVEQYFEMNILFEMLARQVRAPADERHVVSVCSMVFILLNKVNGLLAHRNSEPLGKGAAYVRKIVQFIDENYRSPISLERLAAEFRLNPCYISHIFRNITGFSVMSYIQHRRLIEAQRMLRNQQADITSVCYDCGFSSLPYFYRVFKKIVGTTPRSYRESLGGSRL